MNRHLLPLCAMTTVLLGLCSWASALPRLSALSLRGGERGLALVLEATEPFTQECRTLTRQLPDGGVVLGIHIPNCRSGLADSLFGIDSPGKGIRRISVHDRPARRSVDIAIEMDAIADLVVQPVHKGKYQFVSLSRTAVREMDWSSTAVPARPVTAPRSSNAAQNQRRQTQLPQQPARLQNITISSARGVTRLRFICDSDVKAVWQRRGDRVLVAFPGTVSSLNNAQLSPGGPVIGSIELSTAPSRPGWLYASVKLSSQSGSLVASHHKTEVLLIVQTPANEAFAYWNAHEASGVSFDPQAPRALAAIAMRPSEEGAQVVPPKAVAAPLLAVTAVPDVNLRAEPTTGPQGRILARLRQGAALNVVVQGDEWCRVESGGASGWIHRSLITFESAGELVDNAPAPVSASVAGGAMVQAVVKTVIAARPVPGSTAFESDPQLAALDPLTGHSAALAPQQVTYRIFGRDPFIPYFRENDEALPVAANLQLVGILADEEEKMALLENTDNREKAYILRENDMVRNGKVMRIDSESIVFLITEYGVARTYRLNLKKKGETGNP